VTRGQALPKAPVSLSLTDEERLCMLAEGGRWRLWLEPERLMLPTLFVSSLWRRNYKLQICKKAIITRIGNAVHFWIIFCETEQDQNEDFLRTHMPVVKS
jgi:hypothetical protein